MAAFAGAYCDFHIPAEASKTPTVQEAQEQPKSNNLATRLVKKVSSGLKINMKKLYQPVSLNHQVVLTKEGSSVSSTASDGHRSEHSKEFANGPVDASLISTNSEGKRNTFRDLVQKLSNKVVKTLRKLGSNATDTIIEPVSVPFSEVSITSKDQLAANTSDAAHAPTSKHFTFTKSTENKILGNVATSSVWRKFHASNRPMSEIPASRNGKNKDSCSDANFCTEAKRPNVLNMCQAWEKRSANESPPDQLVPVN